LGAVCGAVHGAPPARNSLLIYYMLFNTLLSVVSATSTSATFGGDDGLFHHEARGGVRQTAEGLARMLADLLWLTMFAPIFILTIRTFAALRMELGATWLLTTWAMSSLGYFFTLVAPSNANVLAATSALLICTLANGFFGLKVGWILQMSPGFNSYLLITLGAVVAEPFDTTRAFLLKLLRDEGMVPRGLVDIYEYETEANGWRANCLWNLFMFGLIVRLLVLALFYVRSHQLHQGVRMRLKRMGRSELRGTGHSYVQTSACTNYAGVSCAASYSIDDTGEEDAGWESDLMRAAQSRAQNFQEPMSPVSPVSPMYEQNVHKRTYSREADHDRMPLDQPVASSSAPAAQEEKEAPSPAPESTSSWLGGLLSFGSTPGSTSASGPDGGRRGSFALGVDEPRR